jgi:HPt (histidine-containing phosphotransfer) domain-containing protein
MSRPDSFCFDHLFAYCDPMETNAIRQTKDIGGRMTSIAEVLTDDLVDKVIFADYVSTRRPEQLLRTLAIFAAELEDKVKALSDIISNRDVDAFRALTHSMLGSAAMLGAQRMVHLSSTLQQEYHETQAMNWASADELQLVAKETAFVFKNLGAMRQIEEFIGQAASSTDRGRTSRLDGVATDPPTPAGVRNG